MSAEGTVMPAPPGYSINLVDADYIGYQLVIASTVSAALSAAVLALRLYTRQALVRCFGWDDGWIICAWLCAIALTVGNCVETKYGMGSHLWNIRISDFDVYLKLQLLIGTAYICALAFVKVSICCFYLRLSPEKTFRALVFLVIAFTASYSFAGFLVLIFSCNPIAASWDLALASLPTTTCVNRPADYLAQSSLNIVTDICIFLLPLHTVWSLQLPFRQKLSVSLLFAIGMVVCVISMIRLKSVVTVLNSSDASWDTSNLLIWSTIEVHMTIVCACIATLKPFAKRYFPKLLGKSSVVDASYPGIHGKSNKFGNGGGGGGVSQQDGNSFAMQSFHGRMDSGQHVAVVTSKATRDPRRYHGDAESQESIMGDLKEGVFVTHTVQVS